MEIQELKALIKETMREVLQEERLRLCQILIPYIGDDEQRLAPDRFIRPKRIVNILKE